MPRNEAWWNPYRMVPVRDEVERHAPLTHEKFSGESGVLHCFLENLTPLCVGRETHGSQVQFFVRGRECRIPGSSLKGMLRSLAELVGGGCNVVGTAPPPPHAPCNNARNLCIACRTFGMMERQGNARVHLGKATVSDALLEGEGRGQTFEMYPGSPRATHAAFYLNPATEQNDRRCRKMYFHMPARREAPLPVPANIPPDARARNTKNLQSLLAGHRFSFRVSFESLEPGELDLLLYVLTLEENVEVVLEETGLELQGPMRHKLGMGKAVGMGSCRIGIERWEALPSGRERFASLIPVAREMREGEALRQRVAERTTPYVQDRSATMTQLRKMMVWDERDARTFRYPEYHWFRAPGNSETPLKRI